jgi:hypothetical protein
VEQDNLSIIDEWLNNQPKINKKTSTGEANIREVTEEDSTSS